MASDALTEFFSSSALVASSCFLQRFGCGCARVAALRDDVADGRHGAGQRDEGEHRQAGHRRKEQEQRSCDVERARMGAELAEDGLVGGAARAALGDQQAGGKRDDQRRDLRDQAVADRQLDENVGGFAHVHAMAEVADRDAADDVDER